MGTASVLQRPKYESEVYSASVMLLEMMGAEDIGLDLEDLDFEWDICYIIYVS